MSDYRGAAIDIGSNTTLYLLGDVDDAGKIVAVDESIQANGIGNEVFHTGRLSAETILKNVSMIEQLSENTYWRGGEMIRIAGTAALRKAHNTSELIAAVKDKLGVEIEILTGEEEARLTYSGYLSNPSAESGKALLIDIGGGSTEIIFGDGGEIESAESIEIGAVMLQQKFNLGDPPEMRNYEAMAQFAGDEISRLKFNQLPDDVKLVFSGGTATCLAALKFNQKVYNPAEIEGIALEIKWIEGALSRFIEASEAQRREILVFDPDRAAVIIGGTVIMIILLNKLARDSCFVTHRGLRFGLLAELFRKS